MLFILLLVSVIVILVIGVESEGVGEEVMIWELVFRGVFVLVVFLLTLKRERSEWALEVFFSFTRTTFPKAPSPKERVTS